MTERRLYAPSIPATGGAVTLAEAPSRHVRVLRLKAGDAVILFDGRGREASARIETVRAQEVICHADPPNDVVRRQTRLVLMLAVPKGSKVDDCVRMATELGVDEVALMHTERTIPRWDASRVELRLDRLTRIASEASAQSERGDVPIIHPPEACQAWLGRVPHHALGIIFGARADSRLDALVHVPEQVWCAIGPEGGFTLAEFEAFQGAGFAVASLGELVLRVETAVPAAMALIRDRLAALTSPLTP